MGFARGPAELLAAHHMQDLPAEAAVAQERRDVGVGSKAPEAVILPEERGRSGADRGIGRIGIAEEGGIARVEADARRGVDDGGQARALTAIFGPNLNVFKGLAVNFGIFDEGSTI